LNILITAKGYSKLSLILLAYIAFIALGMPDGLLGVAWPSMRAGFSIPLDSLGLLLFAAVTGYMTSSFLSGALIADESTCMLDASLRVTVLNLLMDLRKQQDMSIMFVTHDLGQAYYISDRVLVMSQGKLVEQGPVEDVLSNPQEEFTKMLMASVPLLRAGEALWNI